MKQLLSIFMALSAVGLILSGIVHISALLGYAPFGELSWGLHGGIFIVWFPAVITMMSQYKGGIFTMDWKEAFILNPFKHRFFSGCPKWMVVITSGLFIYGIINFIIFMINEKSTGVQGEDVAQILRGFSGHWMIFYSVALSILYSRIQQTKKPSKEDKNTINQLTSQ